VVLVGGIAQKIDCSELVAEGIHAIQWYNDRGEIEFINTFGTAIKANELFDDFTPYQKYVDQWEVAYQAAVVERAELERQAREFASPEGQAKRRAEFVEDIRQIIKTVLREEKLIE
jgi:hypothetical protein